MQMEWIDYSDTTLIDGIPCPAVYHFTSPDAKRQIAENLAEWQRAFDETSLKTSSLAGGGHDKSDMNELTTRIADLESQVKSLNRRIYDLNERIDRYHGVV